MKNRFLLSIIVLSFVISFISCGEKKPGSNQIYLPETWNFHTGDDMSYALEDFNDSGWKQIRVGQVWDTQGYKDLDNYAWYRIAFDLSSTLKENSILKDSVKIYLGKIDDFDEVFLNGEIIGYNGITLPRGSKLPERFNVEPSPWYLERNYVISSDDKRLHWDDINVIAVRVWDRGGLGGMYFGKPRIGMVDLGDYLKTDHLTSTFSLQNKKATKGFKIWNTSGYLQIKGTYQISAVSDFSGEEIYQEANTFNLSIGGQMNIQVEIPEQKEPTTLHYIFSPSESNSEIVFTDILPYILTPPNTDEPKINGPKIIGERMGKPFLFKIPITGKRPLKINAEGLPLGLALDEEKGFISGSSSFLGSHDVKITVENSFGKTSEILKIVIGDQIALTPPMGWNSWNCWGLSVDQEKVIASANVFVEKGLADHGWNYINIDDGWEIRDDSPEPKRNEDGTIRTNEKFPDMKSLGDEIHSLGLKFGIYSSPGPITCGGYTASYGHELQDAQSFSSWGVDYLKYDWCSYGKIAKDRSLPELKKPYFMMRDALQKIDRYIVYSLCQYGMGNVWEWGADVGGNLWRTTGDITDTWESLKSIGFRLPENALYAKPGHWNDPDMLIVGWVGWGPNLHPTRLTPNEQYTHISLWSLLSAPLLIGCDLERLDDFTLNLLTNDEVIDIDQDMLGRQAELIITDGDVQVWTKELADGNKAIGVFNLGETVLDYKFVFNKAGLPLKVGLRDVWRQKDLGFFENKVSLKLPAHGVSLLKTIGK